MGPIVRANDFIPQIRQPYHVSETDFAKGFYLIISGLFKKLIISDYITLNFVNYVFDDPARYTGLENLFAVYGYAIVIYCDFSGYSDVAIGIAKWLGFHIPTNFLSPYQSTNITEFWRRWHISLSSWLKDYLYIPLGGNRLATKGTYFFTALIFTSSLLVTTHALDLSIYHGLALSIGIVLLLVVPSLVRHDLKGIATNLNLMTTMFLGGLWHGASWNFIVWGSLHGIALAIHKIWMILTGRVADKFKENKWIKVLALILTFHFVCFCWIFFKAADFHIANDMIHQIRYNFSFSVWGAFYANYKAVLFMIVLAGILHAIPDNLADRMIERFPRIPMVAYLAIFLAFALLYGAFKTAEPVLPIYLQF
jgi:D-alanyl-lipoteichoic acid acyltransferase DltB (MBOAT superfamily)